MKKKTLDIILPCYNPADNWEYKVLENLNNLETQLENYDWRVVIVNDGTSNNNFNHEKLTASKFQIQLEEYSDNKGKGYALRKGVYESDSEFIIYTDVDFPYTSESFLEVLENLKTSDVVLTKRNEAYYEQVPIVREFISKTLKFIVKHIFKLDFTDTQAGLKGFNRTSKKHFLATKSNRYLFDLEFVKHVKQDSSIKNKIITVQLKDGVEFSNIHFFSLAYEFISLLKIILR